MFKNSFIILFLSVFIFSNILNAKQNDKQLQIIAKNIEVTNGFINANGKVLIFSPHYYITANKVIYNKTKQKLELFGNVNVSQNNEAISLSNYALIDLTNEINSANPVLLIDKKSDIWIDAKSVKKNKNINTISKATLSSCNCNNPAWSLGFSSANYNTKTQWINTYYNTLYIKDIPAWYILIPLYPYLASEQLLLSYLILNPPYIGFSTINERTSGLLRPEIGFSKSQGYLYSQPIFFAPKENYDFEYIPKIKTLRGYGHELKYRYKDSLYSQLNISLGKFIEYNDYYTKHNLKNKEHYGWDLDYTRTSIFSNNNSKDALIIYLQDMNDIEYKNTKFKQNNLQYDKIIKSKIEYFYNTNKYFTDMHIEQYSDISSQNDDILFQTRPKIKVHKYTSSFFNSNLLSYSFDIDYYNKTRSIGIGAKTTNITLPIVYSRYFFNNYLNISLKEELNFKNINYTNDDNNYSDLNYVSNKHILEISSDLIKSYENIIHTITFDASIYKSSQIYIKGKYFGINSEDENLKPFYGSKDIDNLKLSINQNIYSKYILKNIFNHKISQSIYKKNIQQSKLGNLENELKYSFTNGNIFNRTYYNHDDNLITKSTFAFDYKNEDDFFTNIDYSYSIDKNSSTNSYKNMKSNKSITLEIGSKVFKYYTMKYKEQYDITNNIIKIKEYSLNINKKCWEFDIKLSDELIASGTNDESATRQKTIYATMTLKPLVSVKQKYIFDENK